MQSMRLGLRAVRERKVVIPVPLERKTSPREQVLAEQQCEGGIPDLVDLRREKERERRHENQAAHPQIAARVHGFVSRPPFAISSTSRVLTGFKALEKRGRVLVLAQRVLLRDEPAARLARVLENVELDKGVVRRPGHEIDNHFARLWILDDGALRAGILLPQRAHEVFRHRARIVQLRIFADRGQLGPRRQLLALRQKLPHALARILGGGGQPQRRAVEHHALLLGRQPCRRANGSNRRGEQTE